MWNLCVRGCYDDSVKDERSVEWKELEVEWEKVHSSHNQLQMCLEESTNSADTQLKHIIHIYARPQNRQAQRFELKMCIPQSIRKIADNSFPKIPEICFWCGQHLKILFIASVTEMFFSTSVLVCSWKARNRCSLKEWEIICIIYCLDFIRWLKAEMPVLLCTVLFQQVWLEPTKLIVKQVRRKYT